MLWRCQHAPYPPLSAVEQVSRDGIRLFHLCACVLNQKYLDIEAVNFEAGTLVPHGHRRWFSKKALSLAFVLLHFHSFSWIIHHRECFSIESRGVHLQNESALIPQLLKCQRFEQVILAI